MANVAKLKERARALEQREQWKEALDLYQQVVDETAGEDVDTGLWNRIGDLHLRLGQTERAVDAYDQAVDAYSEAGLHNNAIALCRKILRVAPGRAGVYLKLGRISAVHGFLADARQNFLEYAQRMQRAGQLDASFTALKEFADLSPEDTELRTLLADQLRSHGREEEADRVLAMEPESGASTAAEETDHEGLAAPETAELSLELPPEEEEAAPLPGLELPPAPEEPAEPEVQALEGLETSEGYAAWDDEGVVEGELDLPLLGAAEEDGPEAYEEEEEPEPLPLLDVELEADPLEALRERVAAAPDDAEALAELVERLEGRGMREEAAAALEGAHGALAGRGRLAEALRVLRSLLERRPSDVRLLQKQVEYAFRLGDTASLVRAYLELGRHLGPPAANPKARAVYERVLDLDPTHEEARRLLARPPAAVREERAPYGAEYVDLGALVMEDEPGEGSTRFVVPEEEPTGDEDHDFAEMLSVFRQKVSENIGTEDSSSHYDLGLAFMEMGLVDEAIAEFQVALRGGANPLATLEVLGRCFMEKGQHAVASRVLERALRLPGAAEAEMIGVSYQLGRCAEALGEAAAACEHYERVVGLDIRFRDAASRLEALRAARL